MRTEDGCIIHECLSGEPEAFGVLVDKYKTGIYAFVYGKLGSFQDAQDVTQEMVAMMDTAFEGQGLRASFTFRVVEAVKRLKINPMPRSAGLPGRAYLAARWMVSSMLSGGSPCSQP